MLTSGCPNSFPMKSGPEEKVPSAESCNEKIERERFTHVALASESTRHQTDEFVKSHSTGEDGGGRSASHRKRAIDSDATNRSTRGVGACSRLMLL